MTPPCVGTISFSSVSSRRQRHIRSFSRTDLFLFSAFRSEKIAAVSVSAEWNAVFRA